MSAILGRRYRRGGAARGVCWDAARTKPHGSREGAGRSGPAAILKAAVGGTEVAALQCVVARAELVFLLWGCYCCAPSPPKKREAKLIARGWSEKQG